MISLDTETTGVDLRHGARPFLVTICGEDGEPTYWEWDVCPYTREVSMPSEDCDEIMEMILGADRIVLQNGKFDVTALRAAGFDFEWPWEKTEDTLIAGHLLASNQPHDLTTMALVYLRRNIKPFEDALEAAVKDARGIARRKLPGWAIAKEGMAGMPSAKNETWRFDTWLPHAVAKELKYADDHPWRTVLSDYANADSSTTLALWRRMEELLAERGLTALYREKMRNLPILFEMEDRGTTIRVPELIAMREEYRGEIEERKARCAAIAAARGHELKLPKSGNNKSLTSFAFDVLKLPVLKRTETGAASLDNDVIEAYKTSLDGERLEFVKCLSGARKRAKSCEFLDKYAVFGIPNGGDVLVLHPSVNPTATATTRMSMSHPNLQQVSKQEAQCEACLGDGCEACGGTGEDLHNVRHVFGPAPGREMWSMDARNIELRIPAYESGERALIDLFEHADDPPFYGSQHMLNMSIVYDDVWRDAVRAVGIAKAAAYCKKKYGAGGQPYHCSKCGGLAMQYQCGEETADRAFRRKGGYKKLKAFLGKIRAHNDRCVEFANRHGYVETIPDHSISPERGYPLLVARSDWGKVLPTTPLNYRTQGTAGWWMVRAMNRCQDKLRRWRAEEGFDGYMALTVHDELVFDFPKGEGREPWRTNLPKIRVLRLLMQKGGDDVGVPTPVSVEYHAKSWAKGLTVEP